MSSRFVLAGLFGAALACASPTAPPAALSSFQVDARGVSSRPPAAPTVDVSRGRITVRAETNTPTPCYTLSGDFNAADRELRLRVSARQNEPVVCALVIGHVSYTAMISVPAGTYTLVVVHEFPNTGWPTTEILRQTVRVD